MFPRFVGHGESEQTNQKVCYVRRLRRTNFEKEHDEVCSPCSQSSMVSFIDAAVIKHDHINDQVSNK